MTPTVAPARRFKTVFHKRRYAKRRRAQLREQKLCISSGTHGPATHGVLCANCRETHRRSH